MNSSVFFSSNVKLINFIIFFSCGTFSFTIPELPEGQQFVLNLKTTWGDRHYIGLNGIELFSSEGHPIAVRKVREHGRKMNLFFFIHDLFVRWKITADPADINILPEYGNDPRVVTNLIDGVNKTRDDIHMWHAPFTAGQSHFIYVTFEQTSRIAMIRIWVNFKDSLIVLNSTFDSLQNYNKNRIHSSRGAKDVEILLDGRLIFKGEVSQACGNINATNDPSAYGEVKKKKNFIDVNRAFLIRRFFSRPTRKFWRKFQRTTKCTSIKKNLMTTMNKVEPEQIVQLQQRLMTWVVVFLFLSELDFDHWTDLIE